ncbi:MAG: hypothetical protein INR68_10425 [Methylobacterium mesophilicum]|nr:hypothetical protein [Methylobacterium mesophilicum]
MPLFAKKTASSRKPLLLGALTVSATVGGLALFSVSGGSAFAGVSSLYANLEPVTASQTSEADRQDRVADRSAEQACRGQAWGRENMDCLTSIARESGRDFIQPNRIIVAGPELQPQTPNAF